jgi:hypothetical protein
MARNDESILNLLVECPWWVRQYGLLWTWDGTVPSVYFPKGKIKGKTVF